MAPNKNDCIPEQFIFEPVLSCPVIVNFKGKPVTSDAPIFINCGTGQKKRNNKSGGSSTYVKNEYSS